MIRSKNLTAMLGALVLALGCTAEPGQSDDGTSDDAEEQPLLGDSSNCSTIDLFRFEFSFDLGYHGNMQVMSGDDQELSEWWNRTDGCSAYVVDWVHEPRSGDEAVREGAFVDGIVAPNLITDADTCSVLQESRKVFTQYSGQPANGLGVASDLAWTSSWNDHAKRCDKALDTNVWFGGTANNYATWFAKQMRIRVASQAFAWIFPASTSAYMQTEKTGLNECSTTCCYGSSREGCFN
jgi:hypothetical protein